MTSRLSHIFLLQWFLHLPLYPQVLDTVKHMILGEMNPLLFSNMARPPVL